MSVLMFWLVAAATAGPGRQGVGAALTADQAVARSRERSVQLAEATADVARAEGAVSAQCGVRHDPTVSGSAAVVGDGWSASMTQPVSLLGDGRAACSGARRVQDAAVARAQRVGLEVAAETRRSWVGAVVARQQREIAERALVAAKEIEGSAQQRQAVGEASQLDLRLARLQVERVRTAWMQATVDEGRRVSELSVWVGRAADGLALPSDPLSGVGIPGEGDGEARSDVLAASAMASSAAAAVRRERVGTLAPVELGVFVGEEGGELRAGPSVSVTLPVWRGNADGRADAAATLASARAQRDAVERRASAEQATTGWVSAALEGAVAEQTGDLPAEARAALDSVVLGYARGELDLLSTAQLQTEILAGHSAWLQGREVVAIARIDRLLAQGDRRLVEGEAD